MLRMLALAAMLVVFLANGFAGSDSLAAAKAKPKANDGYGVDRKRAGTPVCACSSEAVPASTLSA